MTEREVSLIPSLEPNIPKVLTSIETLRAKLSSTKALGAIISRLIAYHDESDALSLKGSGETLETQRSKLQQLRQARLILKRVDTTLFKAEKETFSKLARNLNIEMAVLRRDLKAARNNLTHLEETSGELQSVSQGIEQLARRYCRLDPGAKRCPLCGAMHKEGLKSRLPSRRGAGVGGSALQEASALESKIKNRLSLLDKKKKNLTMLREASSIVLSHRQVVSISVKEVTRVVTNTVEQAASISDAITELQAKRRRLKTKGFTEEDLLELSRLALEVGMGT